MLSFTRVLLVVLALLPFTAQAEDYKIATVDMETAVASSTQYKDWKSQLTSKFTKEQAELKRLADEGNALKEKEKKESDFLSKEQRKELVVQIQRKFQEFQKLKAAVANETQRQEQQFLAQVRPNVEAIIRNLVAKEKIDILLNRRTLLFAKPDMDLTRQVIEELNK